MAKDYAKQSYARSRKNKRTSKRWIMSGILIVVIACLIAWVSFKEKTKLLTLWNNLKTNISHAHQPAQKQLTDTSSAEPEIHFSFYTDLPTMHVDSITEKKNTAS